LALKTSPINYRDSKDREWRPQSLITLNKLADLYRNTKSNQTLFQGSRLGTKNRITDHPDSRWITSPSTPRKNRAETRFRSQIHSNSARLNPKSPHWPTAATRILPSISRRTLFWRGWYAPKSVHVRINGTPQHFLFRALKSNSQASSEISGPCWVTQVLVLLVSRRFSSIETEWSSLQWTTQPCRSSADQPSTIGSQIRSQSHSDPSTGAVKLTQSAQPCI